ncbi:MAG: cytochrome P450 [Thermomicrobiales bacterium]
MAIDQQGRSRRTFDIAEAFATGDPYATYAWFREHDPVSFGPEREWASPPVSLFRHADVFRLLRDNRLGKEWRKLFPADADQPPPDPDSFHAVAGNWMLFRDPPVHTHLRGLANLAFTPRQVEKMRPEVERLAAGLLADLRHRAAEAGSADLIMTYAYPLPTLVIAQILGIPAEDFGKFRRWAGDIAAAIDFQLEGLAELQARVDRTTHELAEYLRWIFSLRKAEPQDDLISRLIAADEDGKRLDEDEVIGTCILLLVAGHETTVNLIGNGTLAMMRHRDQWNVLVADPGLARNATEELLRYDSPVQMTTRVAYEPIELDDGIVLPPATEVIFVLGAANRDPVAFPEPDRLELVRKVDRVMSFGMGIHFCLGSPLARLEGEIAFRTLATGAPEMTWAADAPVWRPGAILHGLHDLPVAFPSRRE